MCCIFIYPTLLFSEDAGFVCGRSGALGVGGNGDDHFTCEARSLLYLCREGNVTRGLKADFEEFHNKSVSAGSCMALILVSGQDAC